MKLFLLSSFLFTISCVFCDEILPESILSEPSSLTIFMSSSDGLFRLFSSTINHGSYVQTNNFNKALTTDDINKISFDGTGFKTISASGTKFSVYGPTGTFKIKNDKDITTSLINFNIPYNPLSKNRIEIFAESNSLAKSFCTLESYSLNQKNNVTAYITCRNCPN